MKKHLPIILAAVLSLAAFTACSDDSSSSKKEKESSSVSESSEASSVEGSSAEDGEMAEMLAKTYAKSAFEAANAYCTDKEEAGEPVTFTLWEFDPTRPDDEEEFEVYINKTLEENYEGYLSFRFEKGQVTSVSYNNKMGETLGSYPEE